MRAIKALVIFMGILIILGMVALVYGFITKAGNLANKKEENTETAPVVAMDLPSISESWDAQLMLKPGETVLDQGRIDGLIWSIRVKSASGETIHHFYDLRNGQKMGQMTVPSQ